MANRLSLSLSLALGASMRVAQRNDETHLDNDVKEEERSGLSFLPFNLKEENCGIPAEYFAVDDEVEQTIHSLKKEIDHSLKSTQDSQNQSSSFLLHSSSSSTSSSTSSTPIASPGRKTMFARIEEVVSTVAKKKPSALEIDAAVESLTSFPKVMEMLPPLPSRTPVDYNSLQRLRVDNRDVFDGMVDTVKEVLKDSNMVNQLSHELQHSYHALDHREGHEDMHNSDVEMMSNTQHHASWSRTREDYFNHNEVCDDCDSRKPSPATKKRDRATTVDIKECENEWDILVRDYQCGICLDLLAAPKLTDCTHSFCGACIQLYFDNKSDIADERGHVSSISRFLGDMGDYLGIAIGDHQPSRRRNNYNNNNNGSNKKDDIIYSCPTCRECINTCTFERVLDRDLLRKVEALQSTDPVVISLMNDWYERRDAFYSNELKKKTDTKALRQRVDRAASDENDADRGRFLGLLEEDALNEVYNLASECIVPLAVLVLMMIAVIRNRH